MIFVGVAVVATLTGYGLVAALVFILVRAGALPGWTASVLTGSIAAVLVLGALGLVVALTRCWRDALRNPRPAPSGPASSEWAPVWTIAILGIVPVLVLLTLQVWLAAPHAESPSNRPHYGAIIDAGSSGSRLAVFEWRVAKNGDIDARRIAAATEKDMNRATGCRLADIQTAGAGTCECLQGIAAHGHAQAAEQARDSRLSAIPLWVKATAGMRALGADATHTPDVAQQSRVLEATGRCLARVPGYRWMGADVIAGSDEGLYAWVAVNFLAQTLHHDAATTIGVVEVGGQSAQIAFRVPGRTFPAPSKGAVLTVPLPSGAVHVYAMSDDELGKDAATRTIGTLATHGECALDGNPASCIKWIDRFLCPGAPGARSCDRHRPGLQPAPGLQFVGLSNFSYVAANVGLSRAHLREVRARADEICGASKSAAARDEAIKQTDVRFRKDVCRDAFYLTRLADAWGLPLDAISPPEARRAADADWPLGAMIVEALRRRD